MLTEQTLEKLYSMKLNVLAEAWLEQQKHPQSSDLSFDERLGLLVERQWLWKENRALTTRLKFAQLRQSACLGTSTTTTPAVSSAPSSSNWPPATGSRFWRYWRGTTQAMGRYGRIRARRHGLRNFAVRVIPSPLSSCTLRKSVSWLSGLMKWG